MGQSPDLGSVDGSDAGDTLVGKTVAGKYAVEALLGSGAMGQVYKARQIALEKTVALKVMHRAIARDPAFAERFHREARAASRLDHPSSIRVLDFGEDDGVTYIAMEYVEGRDLHTLIQAERPLAASRIADILIQALGALVVAHEMGVIHRDLKPENIMIMKGTEEDGRARDVVKVCDFGIAKITTSGDGRPTDPEAARTTAGVIIGTPEYVSPEQARGDSIDLRSDIYSVGVILYELLTGRVPFTAENTIGILLKHVTQEPAAPSELNAAVDGRLEAICLKAMRKAKEERFQSAREMRAELRAVVGGVRQPSSPVLEGELAGTLVAKAVSGRAVSAHAAPVKARSRSAWPVWLGFALIGAGIGLARIYLPAFLARGSPPAPAEAPRTTSGAASAPDPSTGTDPDTSASAAEGTLASSPVPELAPAGPRAAAKPGAVVPRGNAVVKVASVTGATADAVRAALPLGSYKDCYLRELKQANRRVEGHADLKVSFLSSGFFASATGFASPELSKVGQCCAEATLHTPRAVQNANANGGTADVTIVYSLE